MRGCGPESDLGLHPPALKRGRFLTTGGLGTMGYSLPAALGAKIAEPGKQTVVICGDGSFQMFLNELSTLRTLNADVKIVLIRNQVLGLVHQIQESSYPQGPSVWTWSTPLTLACWLTPMEFPMENWPTPPPSTAQWRLCWHSPAPIC